MIELFLLLTVANGTPKIEAFQKEDAACAQYEAESGLSPHIYKELIDRHENVDIKEGVCKPMQKFIGAK